MNTDEFGFWALYAQYQIAVSTIIFSPIYNKFMRKFGVGEESVINLKIYHFKLVSVLTLISAFLFGYFYNISIIDMILLFLYSLLFVLYNYLSIQFRFFSKELYYATHSLLRLFLVAAGIVSVIYIYGSLKLEVLLWLLILSHIPILIASIKYLSIIIKKGDVLEYIHLAGYGTTSTLINGVEKFTYSIVGLSLTELGYYNLVYTLSSSPTILVETLKKTFHPDIYKNVGKGKSILSGFSKLSKMLLLLLAVGQLIIPIVAYYMLTYLNLINEEFYKYPFVTDILILSFGFVLYNYFHFVNPYYFGNKKSPVLIIIQLFSVTVFILFSLMLALFFTDLNSLRSVVISKSVMISLVFILSFTFYKVTTARKTK